MATRRLITCDDSIEAHLIKGRLESDGIECFLTNENFSSLMPMFNNMMGSGIQVIVKEEDYQRARELIMDKISPNNTSLVCSNCGSTDIRLGFGKHKFFVLFNILVAITSIIPLGNIKPKYYCSKCKEEVK